MLFMKILLGLAHINTKHIHRVAQCRVERLNISLLKSLYIYLYLVFNFTPRCITKNGGDKMHNYAHWWSLVTQMRIQVSQMRIQAPLLLIAQQTYIHIQTQEQSDIREDEYRDDIKHKVEMGLLKMCSQCPDFFSTENVILLHFSVDRVPLFKSSESNQCITLAHSL